LSIVNKRRNIKKKKQRGEEDFTRVRTQPSHALWNGCWIKECIGKSID